MNPTLFRVFFSVFNHYYFLSSFFSFVFTYFVYILLFTFGYILLFTFVIHIVLFPNIFLQKFCAKIFCKKKTF